MKVAIIGYELEGRAALHYWLDRGADVTVCRRGPKLNLPKDVQNQWGDEYLDNLNRFDIILRSAGVNPKKILEKNPDVEPKITTTVDEFIRVSPTKNIIGVTGTKGKGTTSALITAMLEAAGKKTHLAGNFGTSPLYLLGRMEQVTADDWVVLELSSFQLEDLRHSPHIAVCLMVQPEHLDWHGSEQAYYKAKSQLFRHQKPQDIAIYYADNVISHKIASNSPGDKIAFYDEPGAYIYDDAIMIDQQVLCKTNELQLLGKHNWQNACAAVTAVWQAVQAPDAIRKVLKTFTGLPHRLEVVRKVDNVRYYNDSFASDPYATVAAIEAIPDNKVMIIGGYERMLPLDQLIDAIMAHKKDIRGLLLVGQSAARVAEALQHAGYDDFHLCTAKTMTEIVHQARGLAKPGDAVVLSPGFASFDMFKNFEVRGDQFKETVNTL
jgi:UDP-N-acetylmuramoylalanine--D-glutamate ligase